MSINLLRLQYKFQTCQLLGRKFLNLWSRNEKLQQTGCNCPRVWRLLTITSAWLSASNTSQRCMVSRGLRGRLNLAPIIYVEIPTLRKIKQHNSTFKRVIGILVNLNISTRILTSITHYIAVEMFLFTRIPKTRFKVSFVV